jgi:hypothetical protein
MTAVGFDSADASSQSDKDFELQRQEKRQAGAPWRGEGKVTFCPNRVRRGELMHLNLKSQHWNLNWPSRCFRA